MGDASALMTTNKRLESQLAASEALIRTLKSESDNHRKAHEAMALDALVARSKIEKHMRSVGPYDMRRIKTVICWAKPSRP